MNSTVLNNEGDWDDATWVLTSSFIIITMQSGFGLLESGLVSNNNQINIMIKNIMDILFGGLSFWIFGYTIIFNKNSNGFIGGDNFFTDQENNYGWLFSNFFFQFTFSTTATTIVSGSMVERTKLISYIIFSFLNTFIYSLPAHWIWNEKGWLKNLGVVDFAGAGPVHLCGAVSGLVGTLILGPRLNKIERQSSVSSIFGLFVLWFGWLGFNCGSTLGITEDKWLYASKAGVTTILASIGGGMSGVLYSYYKFKRYSVNFIINGILSSLVAITCCCIYIKTSESIFIGFISSFISNYLNEYIKKSSIDDPLGVFSVHGIGAIVGILAGGLFTKNINKLGMFNGLFYGGGFYLLGIQILEIISIFVWSLLISYIFFKVIDFTIGLRVSSCDEEIGLDMVYHIINDDIVININDINNNEVKNNNLDIDKNNNEINEKKIDSDDIDVKEKKSVELIRTKLKKSLVQVDNFVFNLPNQSNI